MKEYNLAHEADELELALQIMKFIIIVVCMDSSI